MPIARDKFHSKQLAGFWLKPAWLFNVHCQAKCRFLADCDAIADEDALNVMRAFGDDKEKENSQAQRRAASAHLLRLRKV